MLERAECLFSDRFPINPPMWVATSFRPKVVPDLASPIRTTGFPDIRHQSREEGKPQCTSGGGAREPRNRTLPAVRIVIRQASPPAGIRRAADWWNPRLRGCGPPRFSLAIFTEFEPLFPPPEVACLSVEISACFRPRLPVRLAAAQHQAGKQMNKKATPTVSVIMPIHGSVDWLREALESVQDQSFDSWELIAHLDGENPEAEEILESFGPRFQWTVGKERVGPAIARNQCIARARGTYLAALDSDDKWERDHLLSSVATLTGFPKLVLVSCPAKQVDERGRRLFPKFAPNVSSQVWALLIRNQIGNSGAVFRRDLAVKAGMYDPEVSVSHDYCLWLRLAKFGEFSVDLSRHYFYRVSSSQISLARLPRESIRLVNAARIDLARARGLPLWPLRIWGKIWAVYRKYGPVKFLQSLPRASPGLVHRGPLERDTLRIMHIVNSLGTGGAERLVVELCAEMVKQGHRPFIVALSGETGVPARVASERRLEVIVLGQTRFNPLILKKLKRAAVGADVVHAHLWPSLYWASALRTPKVVTEHNTTNRRRKFSMARQLEGSVYGAFDRVVGISDGVKSSLSSHFEIIRCEVRIETIMNAVSAEFRGPPRSRVSDTPRLIFVGSLTDKKDPLLALRVMSHLPEASLTMVGTGPLLKPLAKLRTEHNLESRVHLIGEIESVHELLETHDILLSTSLFEGFGLVALEAHSAGLPVVGPDVPGLREVVIHGRTGFLYNSRNPPYIASLVSRALEPATYPKLSRQAVAHSKGFSIEQSVISHLRLYQDVLGLGRQGPVTSRGK